MHLDEMFNIIKMYKMKLNATKYAFDVSVEKFLGFMVSQCPIETNLDKIWVMLEMSPPRNAKEVQKLIEKLTPFNRFVYRVTD